MSILKDLSKLYSEIKCILLDIEGTTTSINFVKETLFPLAKNEAEKYLVENWESEETKQDVLLLQQQISDDIKNGVKNAKAMPKNGSKEDKIGILVDNISQMIEMDRKTKALKSFQGHLWKKYYQNGNIKGHLYEDVLDAFEFWKEKGLLIYIYSSGSVEAQKLLFKYSEKGDLLKYINGHFDTNIGMKTDPKSYEGIAKKLECDPEEILFITDLIKEAEASSSIGIKTIVSIRPENPPLSKEDESKFETISSFNPLINLSNKRLKTKH